MQFGVHLPLIGFNGRQPSLDDLTRYVSTARNLGFTTVAANDHLVFPGPWLDGPTALAAVLHESQTMDLMTTVTIPVVRGLVQTAKTLAAIDLLSDERLTVGVSTGSSPLDYRAVGIAFEERWKRLDDIVPALRAAWRGEPYRGRFYGIEGLDLQPRPKRGGPPVWIGSWGSSTGLRRVARLGDGWLASAYNTTPASFGEARKQLSELTSAAGRGDLPNALSTTWMWITDSRTEADTMLRDVLMKIVRRPEEELRERVLIGHREECAAKLRAYGENGLERVLLWPIGDEVRQLERFADTVRPLVR
jgi:alkanesulfonate monooxygenase SsuD/methylene tetrahydromethanopterin reductase-like flavin-dependent oxidoreductase (luciferase family)